MPLKQALTGNFVKTFRRIGAWRKNLSRQRHSYAFRAAVARQIEQIRKSANSPFRRTPHPGHVRGIDFYNGDALIQTMAFAMYKYHRFHGALPDLANPTRYDEHIFRRKFFAEFKMPESGNKLLTSLFVPTHLKDQIRIPKIVWHSPHARLPANDEIDPGLYYLKANHGSNMFQPIEYPLKEEERPLLEGRCGDWLANDYGIHDGEWWYSAFPKEILIEEQVGPSPESIAWNVYVFKDRIGLISAYRKTHRDGRLVEESTWFDEDFQMSQFQSSERPRLQDFQLSQEAKAGLIDAALDIARPFDFIRVDFLMDENERDLPRRNHLHAQQRAEPAVGRADRPFRCPARQHTSLRRPHRLVAPAGDVAFSKKLGFLRVHLLVYSTVP